MDFGTTKVFSKSYFEVELEKILGSLARKDTQHCLVLADIDDFKQINDQYGHVSGDYVIKRIASVMKKNMRKLDIIARIDGDEFAILMDKTPSIDIALMVVNRLKDAIENESYEYQEQSFQVTCSFGVTSFNKTIIDQGLTRENIIAKADKALYESKRKGKNRIHLIHLEEN